MTRHSLLLRPRCARGAMLTSSHALAPASKEAQNASGLPWSLAVELLAKIPAAQLQPASTVARCQHCYAYINKFCSFERKQWMYSSLSDSYKDPAGRLERAELNSEFIDLELTQDYSTLDCPDAVPAVLLVVDVTGDKTYLDAVKSGVQAALEALSDSFLVGLVALSSKVGVYQLGASVPAVKSIPMTQSGELSLTLDEAFDFSQIFVPKSEAQKNFALAVDSLSELADANATHCFGAAISAIANYISLRSAVPPVPYTRVICFLASAGVGVVKPASLDNVRAPADFFVDVGAKLAKVGSRVDLVGLGQAAFGFPQFRPLSELTGGAILLYSDLQRAALPQDLYRQLSGHQGLCGILRLRTIAEIEQEGYLHPRIRGLLTPKPPWQRICIAHINKSLSRCDQFSSLLYTIRVNTALEGRLPTLQVAFAFFHVPPTGPPRRVLRVHTKQLSVMKGWHGLYSGIDPEVVCATVVQRVAKSIISGGFRPAEEQFLEWVQHLVSCARRHASWQPDAIDPATGAYVLPSLEQILRFCFALKRSGLLSVPLNAADQWVYTVHLLCGLPRRLVRRVISPLVLPFSASLEAAGSCLPLNRMSLQVSPVLLLDAYSTIVVLYTDSAGTTPYPPPKESPLREALAIINADRPVTPTVAMGQAGSPEQALFDRYLVEDSPDYPYRSWCASLASGTPVPAAP